jgi:hypothetical protein
LDRAQSQVAGCDAFLSKPVDAGKLYDLLARHLGLTWTYAPGEPDAPAPPAAAAPLIPPPQHELEVLYELTMFGDLQKVREHTRYLEEMDPSYAPFARKIREFAQHFEDEPILSLLSQYMNLTTEA